MSLYDVRIVTGSLTAVAPVRSMEPSARYVLNKRIGRESRRGKASPGVSYECGRSAPLRPLAGCVQSGEEPDGLFPHTPLQAHGPVVSEPRLETCHLGAQTANGFCGRRSLRTTGRSLWLRHFLGIHDARVTSGSHTHYGEETGITLLHSGVCPRAWTMTLFT